MATKAYDLELRPRLMVETIRELQDAGVEPDVWKIEGLDHREDCEKLSLLRNATAAIKSAASSWDAERMTQGARVA